MGDYGSRHYDYCYNDQEFFIERMPNGKFAVWMPNEIMKDGPPGTVVPLDKVYDTRKQALAAAKSVIDSAGLNVD